MKRGQAALEFLMTYGWAILVVLVAIGALAYFGVLRPEKMLPEKCVISTGSGLFCDDYSASGTTVTLKIKNMLSETVNITAITLTATGETCLASTSVPKSISADNSSTFDIPCSTLVAGDKIKGDFTVTFSKVDGLSKSTTGQLVTTAAA